MRFLSSLLLTGLMLCASETSSFYLKNVTVHPVSGPDIPNGAVLVIDGKISAVGAKVAPQGKVRVIDGKGLHVYPGMIDSGTQVGISEISSVRETSDTSELGQFNPQLRPIIAVNPESEHIPVTRANGITTVALMPGSMGARGFGGGATASLIPGQVSLMDLNGWTWEELLRTRTAGMQLSFPAIATVSFDPMTMQVTRGNYPNAKRNRDQQVQELATFFDQARAYATAKKANQSGLKTDLKFDAMIPVLDGKVPLVIFAAREREIKDAIEFADKQKVRIVIAGVTRPGSAVELLAKKKIPVLLPTSQALPPEEDDPYDYAFSLASELNKAGVTIAFASFNTQFARNLPYEASQAVAFGLPYDVALKAVTLTPAQIWGVADQLGSIEAGKVANLIVTDGDPLEVKTNVKMLFIRGNEIAPESKHTEMYKKYMARP